MKDTTLPFSIKVFLIFAAAAFALAAVILIISAGSAATATGSAPALAVTLVDGPNTGVLGPGGQRWFRLETGEYGEQPLTLIFTPDDGQRTRHVAMQVFDESQAPLFHGGDAGSMANLGAGQMVSRDNNPVTGELLWTGWLPGQTSYYVQLTNGSDIAIDYWLFADNIVSYPLGEATAVQPAPAAPVAPEQPQANPGGPPLLTEKTQASLQPGAIHWYTFSHNDLANSNLFQNLNLTLFFTPGDGNRQHQVNFKLFPLSAVEQWQQGKTAQPINFGAGMLISRDGDGSTGERFWSGTVIRDEIYLLAVENGTDVEIAYWLFKADIERMAANPF